MSFEKHNSIITIHCSRYGFNRINNDSISKDKYKNYLLNLQNEYIMKFVINNNV